MAISNEPPNIHNIINFIPDDDLSGLNNLYEQMLKTKLSSINEAVRTQMVKQHSGFSGIAGPIYKDDSGESTTDLQSGETPIAEDYSE